MISEEQLQKWEDICRSSRSHALIYYNDDCLSYHIIYAQSAIKQLITEVRTMKKMLRWFANHCSDLEGHNPDDWIDGVEHEVTKND